VRPAGLGSARLWLAALAALLAAFALLIPLRMATHAILPAVLPEVFAGPWLDAAYLLEVALVEGCKLAALWWLLRRDTGRWFALGIACGTLTGGWDLWLGIANAFRFPGFVTPSLGWGVTFAATVLLHGTLGLLAQGLARERAWWGWAGASVMAFLLVAWRSIAMQIVPVPGMEGLDERHLTWLAFGIATWAVYRHGPRHLAVLCVSVVCGAVALLAVAHQLVPVAGVRRGDPVAVAVVVLGIGFLAAMVAQRSVLPWMRGNPSA
jgi:hypothetical protein